MSEQLASPYVFLSYTSTERERALAIADALEGAGIRVWIDRRNLVGGSSWNASIVDAIRDCTAFALTCSARSLASPNVQQEVQLAWEEQRPILPLMLEQVPIPRELRYPLAGRQWVELLNRPEGAWLPDVLRALAGLGLTPAAPRTADAQAAASETEPPGNLPTPLTSFIGREQELAEITALLGRTRLLTLTGPGGTGKTRLAIAAARQLVLAYPDGVWFVDLSGVGDPAGVIPAIAQVLVVVESEGRSLAISLAAYLRHKRLLLVLDNFEQVIDAALRVYDLLTEVPALTVLVTSRILLRVGGEQEFAVPPLPLPADGEVPAQNAAMQLFVERARALRPDLALTHETAAAVAEICRRLDGLPLAIELAAARIKLLPPSAILARLDRRLPLLTGGARSLPQRQQTLRSTIAWSWDLLSEPEQALFRRLSVFAGGWTVEAAEAVCNPEGALDVLSGLESLVDKSLVRQNEANGEPRFTMLATLHEFAQEQLEASGEVADLHRRHAAYFCALAELADVAYWRSGQAEQDLLRPLDPERGNLFAALQWAQVRAQAEVGLRLAGALNQWFYFRAPGQGRRWLDHMLASPEAQQPNLARAVGLFSAALCGIVQGEQRAAARYAEEASRIFREVEDFPRLSRALVMLGFLLPPTEVVRAQALADEGLALARALGDRFPIGWTEGVAGMVGRGVGGDLAAARGHLEEALRLARSLHADWLTMAMLFFLAEMAYADGERETTRRFWQEARPLAEALGDRFYVALANIYTALLADVEDQRSLAASDWRAALAAARDVSNEALQAICVVAAAESLAGYHRADSGARLLAVSAGVWRDDEQPVFLRLLYHDAYTPAVTATRAALSPEAFAQAWAEGQSLSLDDAVTLALDELSAMALDPTVIQP